MNLHSRHIIETNYECREYFISRIRSGIIKVNHKGINLYIYPFSSILEFEASELYFNKYEEAKQDGMMDDKDAYHLLIDLGEWDDQKQKEFEDILPKHIEYWKVELFNAQFKSESQKTLRKHLDVAKKAYDKLYQIRHSLDYLTYAGYAAFCKNQYLIEHSTFYSNGKKVNWARIDLSTIMNAYYINILSCDLIRILARTNPWRDEWAALNKNGKIFDTTKLTSEQKYLIIWSNMYDNIAESPDCPSELVINDDDMLDGWLVIQRRKRVGAVDEKLSKIKGDEIFLVAESLEDAKRIDTLNDPASRSIKRKRFNELRQKGVVKEQNFTDSKVRQSMEATNAFRQRRGGK